MPCKKTKNKNKWKKLDPEKKRVAEWRTVGAADAHRLASIVCKNEASKYNSKSYNSIFLNRVSFESILVSVEQSLRALLLILFSIFPKSPNHNLFNLYKELKCRSIDEKGIHTEIIQRINDCAQNENMSLISEISEDKLEDELVGSLEEHGSSYPDTKYFHIDRSGELSKDFGFWNHEKQKCETQIKREKEILYCFAVALIKLNQYKIAKREYKTRFGHLPEPEIPEEELVNIMKEYNAFPSAET